MTVESLADRRDAVEASGKNGKTEPQAIGSATPEGLKAMARARAYQRELFEEACKQNVSKHGLCRSTSNLVQYDAPGISSDSEHKKAFVNRICLRHHFHDYSTHLVHT